MTTRCAKNPIITKYDVKPSSDDMEVLGTFNCGVAKYNDEVILLVRVAEKAKDRNGFVRVPIYDYVNQKETILNFDKKCKDIDFSDVRFVRTKEQLFLTSKSHIRLARSKDGVNFTVEDKAFLASDYYYEEYGVEDPRVTFLEGWYYINYSSTSRHGVFTCLARTKDFQTVEKLGIMFLPDNKDVVIFPQKINGKYYVFNRPVSAYFQRPEIWLSCSNDLLSFNQHHLLCDLRENHFDCARIGASCVPFLTEYGWLEIYHGCTQNDRYCLGAMLLDKNDPTKILARSKFPILSPEQPYETDGFMPQVIFSCGAIVEGDKVNIYYGACDESICLATLNLSDILHSLEFFE